MRVNNIINVVKITWFKLKIAIGTENFYILVFDYEVIKHAFLNIFKNYLS